MEENVDNIYEELAKASIELIHREMKEVDEVVVFINTRYPSFFKYIVAYNAGNIDEAKILYEQLKTEYASIDDTPFSFPSNIK